VRTVDRATATTAGDRPGKEPVESSGSRLAAAAAAGPIRRLLRVPGRVTLVGGMILLGLSAIFPIYFMLTNAFRTRDQWAASKLALPTSLSLDQFGQAWAATNDGGYVVNSVIVTVATVTLSVALATTAGYSFAKLRWRASRLTFFFVLGWMAVPPLLLMVPIYVEMVDLGLVNTYWSVVLLYSALNLPFNAYLMTAFFRAIPDELIEAAWMDGASVHMIFARIMAPLSVPAIVTIVIFNVLYVWNEFVFALLLLQSDAVKTLMPGLLQLQGRFFFDYPTLLAGLLIASLPMVAVYLIFQRYLVRAIAAGALK
jgi:ABC-type glycerol-3-phosphate transport system permease component